MKKTIQICTDGTCGGGCLRCRCTRLTVQKDRLEGDLRALRSFLRGVEDAAKMLRTDRADLLDTLKKVHPALVSAVNELPTGLSSPAWKIARDLVETTVKTLDPTWKTQREAAQADLQGRRN